MSATWPKTNIAYELFKGGIEHLDSSTTIVSIPFIFRTCAPSFHCVIGHSFRVFRLPITAILQYLLSMRFSVFSIIMELCHLSPTDSGNAHGTA